MLDISNRGRINVYIFIIYVVLTIVFTYPVAFVEDKIPGIGGDSYWYLWDLWSYKTAVLNFSNPYYTEYIFYPTGVNLAFSAVTPFNAILSIPLQLIFGLILSYNILWLFSFIFAGYGTYLLVKYMTSDVRAAFISGLIFMFSPYHFAHGMSHLNLVAIEWIPFYVLYLFKTVNDSGKRNAVYAAFFLLLVALSEYYYLIYIVTFTVMFIIYCVLADKEIWKKQVAQKLLTMIILFGLSFFPFSYPLLKELATSQSNYMYIGGFVEYSADFLGFFIPAQFHPVLGSYTTSIYDNFAGGMTGYTVFIGYTVLFLTLFTVYKVRTKEIKFWASSAMIFFILALGPKLHINGKLLDYISLPYSIIMNIPIISIARVPSRWDVMVMLSMAVIVGYGLAHILNKMKGIYFGKISKKDVVIIVFVCIILFEYLSIPYPMTSAKVPEFYYMLRDDTGDYAIIETPGNWLGSYANYMYYQTVHKKRIVGGYVSRIPPEDLVFVASPFIYQLSYIPKDIVVNDNTMDYGRNVLNQYDIRYIILHKDSVSKDKVDIIDNLLQHERKVYEDDQLVAYKISETIPKFFISLKDNFSTDILQDGLATWMSNNATILGYSSSVTNFNLSFDAISFYKPRQLYIYLNEELIDKKYIDITSNKFNTKFRLKEGDNIIRFYVPNNCQRPIDVSIYRDIRCLSISFGNISVT